MKLIAVILLLAAAVAADYHDYYEYEEPKYYDRSSYHEYEEPEYYDHSSYDYHRSKGGYKGYDYSDSYDYKRKSGPNVPFVEHSTRDSKGRFSSSFSAGNGIKRSDRGYTTPGKYGGNRQSGSYSYISPEGKYIAAHYTADERGFRIKGNHLPKPVPTEYPLPKVDYKPYTPYKPKRRYPGPYRDW